MVDGAALQSVIQTTFITSGTATLLATLLGVPLGAWCARQRGVVFTRLRTLITALYGLPPVVVGVFVYSLFSRTGVLGDLDLLFTVNAMIVAQTILILPLVWGGAWTAFDSVNAGYRDTLATLGIRPRQRTALEIRLARNGIYHAIVIGFGRAVAEVGAVIMVGGNISGKTRVMTTTIVLETSKGNMEQASALGALLLAMSLLLVALSGFVQHHRRHSRVKLAGAVLPEPNRLDGPLHRTITVKRGDAVLLDDVVVDVEPGSITAVVGESGAGKTTLLRALAGLEQHPAVCGPGACIYLPQEAKMLTSHAAHELMLPSMLFEDLDPYGLAYANLLQITGVLGHDRVLSGGERQRVVLARQLSLRPALLLLDECTSNLGWLNIQTIERELLRLKAGGTAVVLVTHDGQQAQRLADRIMVLRNGRLIDNSDPFALSLLEGRYLDS